MIKPFFPLIILLNKQFIILQQLMNLYILQIGVAITYPSHIRHIYNLLFYNNLRILEHCKSGKQSHIRHIYKLLFYNNLRIFISCKSGKQSHIRHIYNLLFYNNLRILEHCKSGKQSHIRHIYKFLHKL